MKSQLMKVFFVAAIVGAAIGCVHVRIQRTPDIVRTLGSEETVIREARAAQNRAVAAGDIDRAATFWTDDVTMRRGLGAFVSGKDAYKQALMPAANRDSSTIYQRIISEVHASPKWPLAFETGKWYGHLGSATGPTIISGRYSAQWVKRNTRWLIRSELFVALECAESGCASSAVP